jgi:peptide/nickel transport system substrate-binding protein
MLAKIGVKVQLDAIPKAQHFPKIQNRVSDFYMLGWGVSTLDSHYVFSYLFNKEGSWNGIGYDNARVNEITKLIETETDIPKRTALIDEAWHIIKAEMPYLPVHHQVLGWSMRENYDIPMDAQDYLQPRFVVIN